MADILFFRPIKTNKLTQAFGANDVCAKTMPGGFPAVRPYRLVNKIGGVCPQGSKDFYRLQGYKGHNGGDWAAWHLEPAYHCGMFNGWMRTGYDRAGGLNVDVVSLDPLVECTDGCPAGTKHFIFVRYAHGAKVIGWDRKIIKPGNNVQLCDNTGDSSGDHLHWAPKWCDEIGNPLHKDNGYGGAFNYTPYFQNVFILDHLAASAASPTPAPAPAELDLWQQLYKAVFQLRELLSPR